MNGIATWLVTLAATGVVDSGARPITLEEALALAQRNALQVVQAAGQTRTAGAAVRASYAAFLPSVSLSAGANRQLPAGARTRVENGQVITLPSDPWSSSIGLGASVDLFTGGERLFTIREARAQQRAARVNEVAQHYDAALATRQQYFNVLAARESEAAADAQLEQAERQFKFSVAQLRARTATRSDSLRGIIQVRAAQLAITSARNDLAAANASLTRAIGADALVTAAPADSSVGLEAITLDEPALRALAADGPPVRQAQAELDAARAARSASWTNYLPSVSASYSRSGAGTAGDFTLSDRDYTYAGSLRFALTFPIFDQFRREQQVTQAQVATTNAEASLRDARLAAMQGVTQSLGDYRAAGERVASQVATVEAALEDLRVQQQRYTSGGATQLDVLTSQTQLDQARRDLIRARYDQRIARAQLEALVGRDL